MTILADRACKPLPKGTPALAPAAAHACLAEVGDSWSIADGKLTAEFTFPDFLTALKFTNTVGALAEAEEHHPDIHLAWGKVGIVTWTHSVGGLSENDFILAAKIQEIAP